MFRWQFFLAFLSARPVQETCSFILPLEMFWFIVQWNGPLAIARANLGGFVVTLSSSQRLIVPMLLVVSLLFCSCSRDPNVRKQKYFQTGQRYFEKGKYREAAIEFVNAIKIDPSYAEAHHQLAETYLKLQKGQGAYQELARTVELQPENYQARIELANLLILGHDFPLAQEQTDLLLEKRPNDPLVHSLVSSLLAGQGNLSGAIEELQKAIALDSGRWGLYLELAMLQIRTNQPDAAEASFKKVIEVNPAATQAHLLLGTFYQSRSRFSEAEQQFHIAIEMDPKSPEARAALARLYLAEGKNAEAQEFLKQAKRDFPDDSAGYRMLGDFYFATGNLDKAVAEYGTLCQEHPNDIQVKKNYIQLLIQNNRFDEASKLNDEILQANPHDNDALVSRSEMQISRGNLNDATAILQTVIKNDPNNGEAHYSLGVAFDKSGDLERAETEWIEAVRLRPDLVDAQRALAGAALRRGDPSRLAEAATQIITLQPNSPDGYALRALSEINRNQLAAAETDIRKAIDVAPQSSLGYVQLGNLKFAQKQYGEAGEAYQQALGLNANSKDALRGLMNTYIAQKQIDRAIAAANAQIAKSPNNSGFYDLLGSALFHVKKDLNGAEAACNKALSLDRKNSDALMKLAQVQAAEGNADRAIATCQQAIKDHPRMPEFYAVLGELYGSKGDWTEAKNAYQKALDLNSNNPLASMRLAKILLQSGGNVDVALSLAQTARRSMPDSSDAADTLGWIYYQKGAYPLAVSLFEQALKLQQKNHAPDNPDIHYHLGLAYQKTEQPALARQHLERALKINPNYSAAAEIKKQLSSLKS